MKAPKVHRHPRIEAARLLDCCVVLCCNQLRPGLNEKDVEKGVCDLLRAEGWQVFPVIAEITGRHRKAEKGALDLVAFEPGRFRFPFGGGSAVIQPAPWWIEVKRGDRDLTPEQLDQIKIAPQFGAHCIVTDESTLVREWLANRK